MKPTLSFIIDEPEILDLIKTRLGQAGYQISGELVITAQAEILEQEAANPTPKLPFQAAPSTAETAAPGRTSRKSKRSTTR